MNLSVDEIARGMLRRYSSAKLAMEMAHWHGMDYGPGSEGRKKWAQVRREIARLSKEGGKL